MSKTPAQIDAAAKATGLAVAEAKKALTTWAESTMADDDGKMGLVIIGSIKMTVDAIIAVNGLDEHVMSKRTLQQIDLLLTPLIDALRKRVAEAAC